MVMAEINYEEFKLYIHHILKASTDEILFSGALGNPAELSSAKHLRSEGSLIQLWSASSYIELIFSLNQDKSIIGKILKVIKG